MVVLSPAELALKHAELKKGALEEGVRLKAEAADALEKFKTTDAWRLQQEEELWTHSNIYLLFLHGTFEILFCL